MRLPLLTFLASLAPSVLAYPQITYPAAGAQIPAGSLTVKWTDDGTAPAISQLASYTLTLYVGGNTAAESASLVAIGAQPGKFTSNQAVGTIDPSLTASLTNGFYLEMIATAKEGGTVTIYSDRFTLTGMTGTPESAAIRQAVTALVGATAGPPDVNGVVAAAPAAPAAGASPAAGAAGFGVPYNQQQGTAKYAPMQGIPPTKISLNNFTPLFPTSAYTVATTWLGQPTVLTTFTESQTFSVQSSINTAAPQSQPTGNNVQKFLARWKD